MWTTASLYFVDGHIALLCRSLIAFHAQNDSSAPVTDVWQENCAGTLDVTVASLAVVSQESCSLFSLLPLSQPLSSPTVEEHVKLCLTCTHTPTICKKKYLQQIPGSINTGDL